MKFSRKVLAYIARSELSKERQVDSVPALVIVGIGLLKKNLVHNKPIQRC
jgi:hypothetical protein